MTRKITKITALIFAVSIFFYPIHSSAEIEIVLKKSFIENYKDRVTIDTTFIIEKSKDRPNLPKKDGDLHIAGTSGDVQFPIVAEIMNAKHFRNAVIFLTLWSPLTVTNIKMPKGHLRDTRTLGVNFQRTKIREPSKLIQSWQVIIM